MAVSKHYRENLLIAGFVKQIENEYQIKNIPEAINTVICSFLRLSDIWNRTYSYKDGIIDENGYTVTMSTDAYMSMFGLYVVTEGVFKWKIKLIKWNEDNYGACSPYIGIIEDNKEYIKNYLNDNNWDQYGYQISSAPARYHRGSGSVVRKCDYTLRWCKQGDILEMTLDLDERTLSFKLNDEDFGVVFSNIVLGSYRLALTVLECEGACFQLL